MNRIFSKFSSFMSILIGKPTTLVLNILLVFIMIIVCYEVRNDTLLLIWNTFLSVASYIFFFILQNSQNSGNAALHAKLDNLILSIDNANNELIGSETKTIEELQQITEKIQNGNKINTK